MFRRFSPRAREVIISAQQEARALHHNFIGTEHILLGLLREEEGLAARVLESLGAVDRRGVPKWLELDKDAFKGRLTSLPAREDLTLPIREQLIVELYSR